ncbi:hypothetical protein Tco_0617359 [Tanacetum coccineum]
MPYSVGCRMRLEMLGSYVVLEARECKLYSSEEERGGNRVVKGPSPQPRALDTTFEARVRDYMAAHTERMERFKNTIFKQREEINGRMTEMFGLLKELTTSRIPEKVLIRKEAKFPVTKNVNSISLARNEGEENNKTDETPDNTKMPTEMEMPVRKAEAMNGAENRTRNEPVKAPKNDEVVEAPGSQPVAYYPKHKINEKLIKGLVNNNIFNNSLSGTRVGKKKKKAYNVLPGGPIYEAILKKKITKKEDIGGNFKIPCSIGGLKHVHALVDQGSDVNVMPYSTYMKLADKRPAETDIRLSLASHSYIYPLRNSRRRVSREEEEGIDDEGEVTLYLMRRALEVLRKFHWMILGG